MKRSAFLAIVALVVFAASAVSLDTSSAKMFKSTAGATANADSQGTAADTSTSVKLPSTCTSWHASYSVDSTAWCYVQVSPDDTNWFTVETDTVTSGTAEYSAHFTNGQYAGNYVRIIMDDTTGTASSYGASFVHWAK
jgi:hypothetical protein